MKRLDNYETVLIGIGGTTLSSFMAGLTFGGLINAIVWSFVSIIIWTFVITVNILILQLSYRNSEQDIEQQKRIDESERLRNERMEKRLQILKEARNILKDRGIEQKELENRIKLAEDKIAGTTQDIVEPDDN